MFRRKLTTGWWIPPAVATAVIAASALVAKAAVRDAVYGHPAPGVRFVVPVSYVVFSPLNRAFDLICLLSVPQHIALLAVIAMWIGIWRWLRARSGKPTSFRREALTLSVCIILLAIVYVGAIAGPRPMAAIAVDDADLIRVDFHSHSNVSGDARRSFSPAANREWHRAAGFDVTYITDHRRFRGAQAAAALNPARAGDGFVALSGFEGRFGGVDIIVPGMTVADSAMIGVRQRLDLDTLASGREPVVIAAVPVRNIERIDSIASVDTAYIRAVELVDGAPRGLLEEQRHGGRLRQIANSHNLLLVGGSNNHGWGRTAVVWNVVRVPGWRLLAPDSVGALLEQVLRSRDRERLQVIERVRPWAGNGALRLAATAPDALWVNLTTLTPSERLAWIAWAWIIALLVYMSRPTRPVDRDQLTATSRT